MTISHHACQPPLRCDAANATPHPFWLNAGPAHSAETLVVARLGRSDISNRDGIGCYSGNVVIFTELV
jgi:hypothetical protein